MEFPTDQSKLTFWKSGSGVFTTRVSLRHMLSCKHAFSANQRARTVLDILWKDLLKTGSLDNAI